MFVGVGAQRRFHLEMKLNQVPFVFVFERESSETAEKWDFAKASIS